MGKVVAIVQSNYIPWKGYFDLIRRADEFILFDDVQYTRRDWRNRNVIKTSNGLLWLTIPVQVKGKVLQKIKETVISDAEWRQRHWKAITLNYAKAACFRQYAPRLGDLYSRATSSHLSEINHHFIKGICELLDIHTTLSWSMQYPIVEGKTERLLDLCKKAGATTYLSGPAARAYLDQEQFAREGIHVEYMDYSGYPEYGQLYPPFEHRVSIIDVILNTGRDAPQFIRSAA